VSTPDPRPAGTPGSDPTIGAPTGTSAVPPTGAAGPGPAAQGSPGPAAAPETRSRPQPARRTGRTIGRTLALALLVFVTVVLVLFVVFNTQTVQISLVFADVRAPLVVALLIAAVLGGAVVGLLDALMTVRGRRKNR
jgi:uncharacterized integral membrane protein